MGTGECLDRALPCPLADPVFIRSLVVLLFISLLAGCRTTPHLPPVNLSSPGWQVRHGQAVWVARQEAPEIAGELTVGLHRDGRGYLHFLKVPIPFVSAQSGPEGWQIEFIPQDRKFAGRGAPHRRFGWLMLLKALQEDSLPKGWEFSSEPGGDWKLSNRSTGEMISGFLNP